MLLFEHDLRANAFGVVGQGITASHFPEADTRHAFHVTSPPGRMKKGGPLVGTAFNRSQVGPVARAYFASTYFPSFTVSRMRERSSRP